MPRPDGYRGPRIGPKNPRPTLRFEDPIDLVEARSLALGVTNKTRRDMFGKVIDRLEKRENEARGTRNLTKRLRDKADALALRLDRKGLRRVELGNGQAVLLSPTAQPGDLYLEPGAEGGAWKLGDDYTTLVRLR